MTLWDYLFDDDRKQRDDINSLQTSTSLASSQAGRSHRRADRLQREVEQQALLIEALFRIVKSKNLISDEEIKDVIAQIDLEDGIEDGRIGRSRVKRAPKCTNCQRPVNLKRDHCVYCHHPVDAKDAKTPYR